MNNYNKPSQMRIFSSNQRGDKNDTFSNTCLKSCVCQVWEGVDANDSLSCTRLCLTKKVKNQIDSRLKAYLTVRRGEKKTPFISNDI